MDNIEFWESIQNIIKDGFTSEGLSKLEIYAEQFIENRIIYKRFSPSEQYGCSAGGTTHVIASLLAGAENTPDKQLEGLSDFKIECKHAETQAVLETHAIAARLPSTPARR